MHLKITLPSECTNASLPSPFRYTEQMTAIEATPEASVAWFGLTFLLKPEFAHLRHVYAKHLTARGCENRPVIR